MARDQIAQIARKNLDSKLSRLREHQPVRPRGGWIRDALGMTTRQLAARMGVAQSRIVALEKAEANGATTLKSLRDAAEALNCTLVYALVPKAPLDDILRERARAKASSQFGQVSHGMLLENQALTADQMKDEIDRLTDDILAEPSRLLWEDE